MPKTVAELLAEAEQLLTRAEADNRDLDDDEVAAYDDLLARAERQKKIDHMRHLVDTGQAHLEPAVGPLGPQAMVRDEDPWRGLGDNVTLADSPDGLVTRAHRAVERVEGIPDTGRELLERMLTNPDEDAARAATFVLAASDPYYRDAFNKAMRSQHGYRSWTTDELEAYQRVEVMRASFSLTSGNGGLLAPIHIDPAIQLSNASTRNPFRALARNEVTVNKTFTGAASAGATAYWTAENTAVTDSTPTFTGITVTPQKMTAWLTGSFEIEQDAPALVAQLPELVADCFDNAEGAAFVYGNGTTEPMGLVTAISATAGSTVTATTRGSFTSASVQDLYAVDNALPARARNGRPAWLAHRKTLNVIRQMSATANGSSFWANLGEATPPRLLDSPIYESSDMASTTTTGTVLAVLGDWSQYLIVTRVGTVIERVDNVVDGSGVPTGTRGWLAWSRVGSAVATAQNWRFLLT